MDSTVPLSHSILNTTSIPGSTSSDTASIASRRLQNAPSHPTPPRDAIARETNRTIRNHLRDDWEWPHAPSANTQTRIDPTTSWRERCSSTTSASSTPPSPDPYKFETPDSIALALASRKRKRGHALQAEMVWNSGLRTYITRRHAWTGGLFAASLPPSTGPLPPSDPTPMLELVPLPSPLIPASNLIRAAITPAAHGAIYDKVVTEGVSPKIPINLADMTQALVGGWKSHGEWPPAGQGADQPLVPRPKGRNAWRVGLDASGLLVTGEEGKRRALKGMGRMRKALGLVGEEGLVGGLVMGRDEDIGLEAG